VGVGWYWSGTGMDNYTRLVLKYAYGGYGVRHEFLPYNLLNLLKTTIFAELCFV